MTPDSLGLQRLQWHREAAEQRDVRMSGWNRRKADTAYRGLSMSDWIRLGPKGFRADNEHDIAAQLDLAWIKAIGLLRSGQPTEALQVRRQAVIRVTGWADCECGRVFQPGERGYRQCYHCSQLAYADGSVACVICQRRHAEKYACCKACTTEKREDQATLIRSVVLRRDGFRCSMCDTEEGTMQIERLDPEGSAWWWNLRCTCTSCHLTKGKQFGPLDELVRLDLIHAYSTYLLDYLDADERAVLRQHRDEALGGAIFGKPARHPYAMGSCDAIQGMLTCLDIFGREGITVEHVEPRGAAVRPIEEEAS